MANTALRTPLSRTTRTISPDASESDAPSEPFVMNHTTRIDLSRWFICPTTTPLYYCPVYQILTEPQQRRYNQLTAMSFNELIAMFEFVGSAALRNLIRSGRVTSPLKADLHTFIADEAQHIEYWHVLNRISDPVAYASQHVAINTHILRAQKWLARLLRRPDWTTALFWLMLLQEERALELSRRSALMSPDAIEPTYRAMYAHHFVDEARHVRFDRQLIEQFFAQQSPVLRRLNAHLFRATVRRYFLPPVRSAQRVIDRWLLEMPELHSLRQEMTSQLSRLTSRRDYVAMMYSRESTPVAFALFDRYSEMHRMGEVLSTYESPREMAHG